MALICGECVPLQTKIRTLKSQVAALEKKVAGSGALEKLLVCEKLSVVSSIAG